MKRLTCRLKTLSRIWRPDNTICAILSAIAILLYLPGLSIWAFGDDFGHLARAAAPARWDIFNTTSFAFRPLENLVNAINVMFLGYEATYFTHLIALLGFIASIILVYQSGRWLRPASRMVALLATTYFTVSPINVMSLVQIDTISQQFATVFVLLLLVWMLTQQHLHPRLHQFIIGLIALFALLAKESSIGVVMVIPLATCFLISPISVKSYRDRLRYVITAYAVIGIVLAIYMGMRWASGAGFGNPGERYSLNLSVILILKNTAQLFVGLIYVGSTIDIFPHLQLGRIVISVIFTLGVMGLGFLGISAMVLQVSPIGQKSWWKTHRSDIWSGQRNASEVLGLILLIVAGMFPVVLTQHMSELYIYSSFPFYALLLGLLIEQGYMIIKSFSNMQSCIAELGVLSLIAMVVWLSFGTKEKLSLALGVSDRAKTYFNQANLLVKGIPENSVTICWEAPANEEEIAYSGFLMPDQVILRGVFSFIGSINSKSIEYVEYSIDSELCDYNATVSSDAVVLSRQ